MMDTFLESKIKDGFKFICDNGLFYFTVRFGSKTILIFINNSDVFLNEDEYKVSENIGHLIGYYLNRLEIAFNEIFTDCSINPENIEFTVFSDTYIKKSLLADKSLLSKVNSKRPIHFECILNKNKIEINVIYAINYIGNLYNSDNNSFEQYIVEELVYNLYSVLKPGLSQIKINETAKTFVNNNIPNGKPGFTLDMIKPINERVVNYSDPINVSEISKSKVEVLVKKFLKKMSIAPGKYSGDDLKKILNQLFNFLQNELEKEIKRYNNSILFFAYAQIEFLKNYRESTEITLGIAQKSFTEYDVIEKKVELLGNTVMRNNILQHMIETILKLNCQNGNDIDVNSFQYLEALTSQACEFALISDLIHYKIIPYEIVVKDDYSFEFDEKNTFDGEEYLTNHSKKGLKYDFTKSERAKDFSLDENDRKGLGLEYEVLDRAFEKELGFKYTELLIITFALGVDINPSDDASYPLVYIDQNSLVNQIKKSIIDDIDNLVIINVLNFISIPYETFKNLDPFVPNLLRMNENRFSIKPLIKFSDEGKIYYLYGALAVYSTCGIYSYKVSTGHFPYQLKEGEITKALKEIEKMHNKKLEMKVDKLASDIFGPENVISNLKKFKNIDKTLPNNPDCGEIDCIVVDKSNKILYVLEAKDVIKALSPKELRNEFNKFFDPNKKKNYSKKLIEKVEFVSKNLELFLKYFNVSNTEEWSIKYAFITYEVHLSAFHKVSDIEFIALTELKEYFLNEEI